MNYVVWRHCCDAFRLHWLPVKVDAERRNKEWERSILFSFNYLAICMHMWCSVVPLLQRVGWYSQSSLRVLQQWSLSEEQAEKQLQMKSKKLLTMTYHAKALHIILVGKYYERQLYNTLVLQCLLKTGHWKSGKLIAKQVPSLVFWRWERVLFVCLHWM